MHQPDHFGNPGLGPVYFVDDHHRGDIPLQGLLQHVAGLGHRAVHCIHQQQAAVRHIHHPFHFAAKIGVARRVNYVYLYSAVVHRRVFGENRDASLPFQRVGIHD